MKKIDKASPYFQTPVPGRWTISKNIIFVEIHTAEPLVPDPIPFDIEIVIAKLKRYKSPGSDQIPTELLKAGGKMLRCLRPTS
jgi:hypothetical protein